MKTYKITLAIILLMIALVSCKKNKEPDNEKPVINLSIQGSFPTNCDTLYFGESFNLKLLFTDNTELGSYSFDIHQNFDHHSHSTEVTECTLDSKKKPLNPFVLIDDYNIPAGLKEYTSNLQIAVPSGNTSGLFDEGDYHFFIRLTDKEGWATQKGLSIKMLRR